MTSIHSDSPDDVESEGAESSETRMRQALERLSGDRFAGDRGGGDRMADRSASVAPRSQGNPQTGFSNGSFSSAGPRRHRYVQDGEVPVVQMSAQRDRRRDQGSPVAAVEPQVDVNRAALGLERAARLRAEQALERAQASLHALETRLGHSEITLTEAVEQARAHERRCLSLQADLAQQAAELRAAELRLVDVTREQDGLRAELERAREQAREARIARAATPRDPAPRTSRVTASRSMKVAAPVIEEDEPEPVKWWLTPAPKSKPRRMA